MTDETASRPPGASIFDPGLFLRTAPLMGARNDYDLSACRLAVLGIPFDWGVHRAHPRRRRAAEEGAVDAANSICVGPPQARLSHCQQRRKVH